MMLQPGQENVMKRFERDRAAARTVQAPAR
jgi:hypothetical protein